MPDDTALPERLLPERFELGELVGSGGVADVYRAHDRRLDRPVAVKFFRRDPADRVDDEVRALARLSHAGLVTIFDVGTHDGLPYLVLELVTGPSLKARLSAGPLTVAETVALGTALAGALAHAHERGVVHRDVKPANILLDGHGVPHLADLGIALLIGGQRRTRTNEILGTPAYLAPEQVLGDAIGPPVDVYALGLVLLECLSGKVEYGEGNELAAALVRLNRPPRIPAGLPEGLAELLVEMTATEPRRRPTASQCEQRLTAATTPLARPLCAASLRADPLHAARTGRRSRRVPMAAAGIGIVALVAGLFFLPGGDPPTPSRIAANQPVDTTVAPVPTTSEQPVTVAP
ncbi:MAG TPA: serine/threonine-protein kinase, partial [Pseudonocardiaceae bacterium]|nr:serine/threonine-protein kinase [Pseudonocardiaceae bacterium]